MRIQYINIIYNIVNNTYNTIIVYNDKVIHASFSCEDDEDMIKKIKDYLTRHVFIQSDILVINHYKL